jgi:hypothetical protein
MRLAALHHIEQAITIEHLAGCSRKAISRRNSTEEIATTAPSGSISRRFSGSSRQPSNRKSSGACASSAAPRLARRSTLRMRATSSRGSKGFTT